MRKCRRVRIEQQARTLDRIAGDANDARALHYLPSLFIGVKHAAYLAVLAVFDSEGLRLGAQIELPGLLSLWDLGIEGRPLRSRFASLEAESELPASRAIVA